MAKGKAAKSESGASMSQYDVPWPVEEVKVEEVVAEKQPVKKNLLQKLTS